MNNKKKLSEMTRELVNQKIKKKKLKIEIRKEIKAIVNQFGVA